VHICNTGVFWKSVIRIFLKSVCADGHRAESSEGSAAVDGGSADDDARASEGAAGSSGCGQEMEDAAKEAEETARVAAAQAAHEE
jgi:hypothetical protein